MTYPPTFRLHPPPLPAALVERAHVTDRILFCEQGGTCLLTAAPGYGSTTALARAMACSPDPAFWVGLDAEVPDDEARALLAAAVGATEVGVDPVLRALVGAESAWLVVDGLDPGTHPALARDLGAIAARLPHNVRLAVSTHTRFGLIPRAIHLDETQLAFDVEESIELIERMSPGVDIEDAGAIVEAAQGWVSALAAGAARSGLRSDRDWLPRQLANDLLAGWFDALPDKARDFLSRTVVLDELSTGPAQAVTGDPQAAEVLLELESAHAFLQPIASPEGHTGRWWRRHPLLSAYLLQRSGADRVGYHSAAADWFASAGDVPRAMHHLVASGRTRDAGSLLTTYESTLFGRGRADQILRWYDQIAVTDDDRIGHLLRIGWGQALSRDVRGADATLAGLQAELATGTAAGQAWAAEEALLRAYLAVFHADPATMISAGRPAMVSDDALMTRDAAQLAPILVMRGLLWSGQLEEAQRLLAATTDRPFPNDLIRESHLRGVRAQIELANGYVSRAHVHADAALQWLDRAGLDPFDVMQFAPLHAAAGVALERGELGVALQSAARIVQHAEEMDNLADAAWALLLIGRVHAAQADLGAALRVLRQARALAVDRTPASLLTVPIDQARAFVHLAAGDMVRAERLIRSLPGSETRSLLWARMGLHTQPALARRTLEGIRAHTPRVACERHLLLACLHMRSSRKMAQGHLRKAADIAHAHGLSSLLSPPDPGLVDLAHDTALEYQDDNLRWLVAARPAAPSRVGAQARLSRGELHLLAILPTRAKNAEIAESMGISVNTVKTRLRRLYAKLGAASRDEAIDRARERGLLGPA